MISTKTHGMLDYMSAGFLFMLPRAMRWRGRVETLLTAMSFMTVAYSLITRYEFGVAKLLPMKTHLIIDTASGVMLMFAPKALRIRNPLVITALVGSGLFEVFAASMTETEPDLPLRAPKDTEFQLPIDAREYARS